DHECNQPESRSSSEASFPTDASFKRTDPARIPAGADTLAFRGLCQSMRHATTSRDFFENKYRQNADPWKFEDSPYEKERYAVILRALMRHDYSRAFEPG